MVFDQCSAAYKELADACNMFADYGAVNRGIPRIDTYTSWIRCRHESIYASVPAAEAYSSRKHVLNEQQLTATARPVIESVDGVLRQLLKTNYAVFLMDEVGLIIDIIYRGVQDIPVGDRCNELYACYNAIDISSHEKKVLEVYGYEHLYPKAVEWHTIGDPIFNYDKSIAGGLGIVSQINDVSSLVPIVKIGSQLIRSDLVFDQIANDKISWLLEEIPDAVIAINGSGTIMNLNQETASFLGLSKQQIKGRKVSKFLTGNVDYNTLYSFSKGFNVFNDVSVRVGEQIYNIVMKKSIIGNYNGTPLILVTFKRKKSNLPTVIQNQYDVFDDLIGESNQIKKVKAIAAKAAQSGANILIQGESGTGKELVAQAIHRASCPQGPFVAVNCGAFTKELLQSELFGYEEGAFTGAKKGGKPGKFEMADNGTLFLDEIGEMPLDMQVSLLRCLQDKTITRVGGTEPKKINLRIIAATNQNLYKQMKEGKFREDLYYRLNVIEILMPPLRERPGDIEMLTSFLVGQIQSEHCSTAELKIDPGVNECLAQYNWPGNVRELRNIMERALIYADGEKITSDCLPDYIRQGRPRSEGNDLRKEYEKMAILEVLNRNKGNISKTAEELGIARSTLYQKMVKLDIPH